MPYQTLLHRCVTLTAVVAVCLSPMAMNGAATAKGAPKGASAKHAPAARPKNSGVRRLPGNRHLHPRRPIYPPAALLRPPPQTIVQNYRWTSRHRRGVQVTSTITGVI